MRVDPAVLRRGEASALLPALAVAGLVLNRFYPPISALFWCTVMGAAAGRAGWRLPAGLETSPLPGVCLEVGIALLGLSSRGAQALLSPGLFAVIVAKVVAGLLLGVAVARLWHLDRALGRLLALGLSVCGITAMLMARSHLRVRDRDVGEAVLAMLFAGVVAMGALPPLGHALGLGSTPFGAWSGTAVDNTAEALATGAEFSPRSAHVAAVVKMARVVMLPVLLPILAPGAGSRQVLRRVPAFVWGFWALVALSWLVAVSPRVVAISSLVSELAFAVACVLLGLGLRSGRPGRGAPGIWLAVGAVQAAGAAGFYALVRWAVH